MKKGVLLIIILFIFSSVGFSQLSGDIVNDGRKITKEGTFIIEGYETGKITFQISVDENGKITSTKELPKESTLKSTPDKILARNHIVSSFEFEPGTWFPKYHQGKITITVVKPK